MAAEEVRDKHADVHDMRGRYLFSLKGWAKHLECGNRYDLLKESVKALYDERMVEMDKVKAEYTKTFSERTADLPKEEADEAKDKMEALCKQYADLSKQYRDTKEQEIEEAYKQWQISQAEERMNRRHSKNDQ